MNVFDACPGCRVAKGSLHVVGCDLEQCASCGADPTACTCPEQAPARVAFGGEFPGTSAARQFGWFTRYTEQGWERCSASDAGATEDLHRVHVEACWIPERQDWVRQPRPSWSTGA